MTNRLQADLAALTADVVAAGTSNLEPRLQRLEDALATMQDQQLMEERVLERVLERFAQPGAARLLRPAGEVVIDAVRPALSAARTTAIPMGPDRLPPPTDPNRAGKPLWLGFELYHELRTMVGMFFDARYQLSPTARYAPLVILVLMSLAWLYFDFTAITGATRYFWLPLYKLIDIGFVLVLYKILSRESVRYREYVAIFSRPRA
jgi:hypothetical protein